MTPAKKYTWSFSVWNLLNDTPQMIAKLQTIWSGIALLITGSTIVASNPTHALIAAIGCAVIDKVIAMFYVEEIK